MSMVASAGLARASRSRTRSEMVRSSMNRRTGGPVSEQPEVRAPRRASTATARAEGFIGPPRCDPGATRSGSCRRSDGRLLAQPSFHRRPVDVAEEGLDVLRLLGDLVVAHERVLPHI